MDIDLNDIPEFEPAKTAKLPSRFLLAGRSNSGKTTYCKYLLYELRDKIDQIVVFSSTAFTGQFKDITHPGNIYEEWDDNVVIKLISMQKKRIENNEKRNSLVIILDDMIGSTLNMETNMTLKKLVTSGRHYNITVIFNVQRLCSISTTIRRNVEFVVFFNILGNEKEFQCAYDEYNAGMDRKTYKELHRLWGYNYQTVITGLQGYDIKTYTDRAILTDDDMKAFRKFVKKRAIKKRESVRISNEPTTIMV